MNFEFDAKPFRKWPKVVRVFVWTIVPAGVFIGLYVLLVSSLAELQ